MKKVLIIISAFAATLLIAVVAIVSVVNNHNKENTTLLSDENIEKISKFSAETAEMLFVSEKNICYSPVSLYMTMCSAAELTNDETADMILKSLGYTKLEDMAMSYNQILKKASSTETSVEKIIIADSVWIKESDLSEAGIQFVKEKKDKLNTEFFCKDYTDEDINSWISEKTNGLIEGDHNSLGLSAVTLADTIYFEDEWNNKFTSNIEDKFKLVSGEKIDVTYMSGDAEKMNVIDGKVYTAVQKKYKGGASMIFVQPNSGSVADLATAENIMDIFEAFYNNGTEERKVKLTVPRFEIATSLENDDVEKALKNVGISGVFEKEAWNDLIVSEDIDRITAEQHTYISVYESGTKAAAVTSIDFTKKPVDDILKVYLDKPFMYIVEKDGVPLFIGSVYNPAE